MRFLQKLKRHSYKSCWMSHTVILSDFYISRILGDLWSAKIKDPKNIDVYRVSLVLFGLLSTPFLLSGTVIHHAHNYASLDPKFVLHFIKSLHVDDLISGADSLLEVQNFFVKCKERLATASFSLRKFISNSGSLNYRINMLHMKIIRLKFSDLCGT